MKILHARHAMSVSYQKDDRKSSGGVNSKGQSLEQEQALEGDVQVSAVCLGNPSQGKSAAAPFPKPFPRHSPWITE